MALISYTLQDKEKEVILWVFINRLKSQNE